MKNNYIGMTIEEAIQTATKENLKHRVMLVNQTISETHDFDLSRVNFIVKDGIVINFNFG